MSELLDKLPERIMVFDTETTGVPDFKGYSYADMKKINDNLLTFDGEMWNTYLETWPLVMQLTYFIYNLETKKVEKIYDNYVDLDDAILNEISRSGVSILQENVTRLRNAAPDKKKPLCNIVCDFFTDMETCGTVVGHNIDFDIRMMIASAKRVYKDSDCKDNICKKLEIIKNGLDNSNKKCTMQDGVEICQLPRMKNKTDKDGNVVLGPDGTPEKVVSMRWVNIIDEQGKEKKELRVNLKPPKLIELYNTLYENKINVGMLHDSKYDVLVTLLVYLKMDDPSYDPRSKTVDSDDDVVMDEFNELVKHIMRPVDPTGGRKRKTRKRMGKNTNRKVGKKSRKVTKRKRKSRRKTKRRKVRK